jgi:hypothetical protein
MLHICNLTGINKSPYRCGGVKRHRLGDITRKLRKAA